MTLRLDSLYDVIVELEEKIEDARLRRDAIKQQAITLENIYKIMVNFDCVYNIINDEEKRNVVTALIKEIGICITKISTFLILCDLAVCLATLYVSFSLVFALMRYLQGKVFLIRFYSPTTLSSSRAEFRLPSRLACA